MHEAAFFWDSIQSKVTIFHVNAYLKVCLECAGSSGWERAWSVFESLGDPMAKSREAPLEDSDAHWKTLYPNSITFTMMLKLCAKSGLQPAIDCGLQLWSEIQKLVNMGKSKNPAKVKIDAPMLNALLGLFVRAPSDTDAHKGLEIVKEFYGLPVNHTVSVESLVTKRSIDLRTLTLLIQFASRLKYPDLGLTWFQIVDKKASEKGVSTRDDGVYKCLAGLLLPAEQNDKLQEFLDQDPKSPSQVTLRNAASAVRLVPWKDKSKWWHRAEEAAEKIGWDNLKFNDVINFLEVASLSGNHREGARLAIQRKKDILQWSHEQLDKALARRTLNPQVPVDEADYALDMKLLRLVLTICSKKEEMFLSKEKQVFLDLLEKQTKQILGDWESITMKMDEKMRGGVQRVGDQENANEEQDKEDPLVALRRRQMLLKASRQR